MLAAAMPATAGYDADDNNSGFTTTMKFARGAYPDQKIVLTEKSSKKIFERGSAGPANPRRTLSWHASNTS
jgi:hypothetical protein